MNNSHLHQLESFAALGSDGGTYRVLAYERRVIDDRIAYPDRWEPSGVAEYRLDSGEPVVLRRDGSMQTAHSHIVLEPL